MDQFDDNSNMMDSRDVWSAEFDCSDIAAVLSGLVDDELPVEVKHRTERHIASCNACRAMVDDAESMNDLLGQALDRVSLLPAGFEDAVLAETTRIPMTRATGGWRVAGGWIAAAAALGLAATVWFVRPGVERSDIAANSSITGASENPGGSRSQSAPSREFGGNERLVASQPSTSPHTRWQPGVEAVSTINDTYLPPITRASLPGVNGSASPVATDGDTDHPWFRVFEDDGDPTFASGALMPEAEEPTAQTTLSWSEEYALAQAASLLEMLYYDDQQSFITVEQIRQTIEYDELLPRLEQARSRLTAADRPTLMSAESVLYRVVHGPINQVDLREMRRTIGSLQLVERLESMSGAAHGNRAM